MDQQQPNSLGTPYCSPKPNARRVLVAVFTCALTGGLALLIWTKLRLVTGVPRTAYAEPAKERPEQKPALRAQQRARDQARDKAIEQSLERQAAAGAPDGN